MAGTPAAGRAYLAIRQYQLAPGRTMEELAALAESGFIPILKQVPGFQEYFLVETGEGVLSISVFTDQAGAEESTRRAADWVQQNLTGFYSGRSRRGLRPALAPIPARLGPRLFSGVVLAPSLRNCPPQQ